MHVSTLLHGRIAAGWGSSVALSMAVSFCRVRRALFTSRAEGVEVLRGQPLF